MYAAIRPTVRSVSIARPKARFIRGRRFPTQSRHRPFHTSRSLAQTPNPPSTPENHALNQSDAAKTDPDNVAAATAAAGEQSSAAAHPDDPDLLAQKLQRSKEMARRYSSALRRSQRRNRAQGLPPIHIPDWFLNRRVRLRKESQRRCGSLALTIQHKESGEHATCEIPLLAESTGVKGVSEMFRAMWGKGLSAKQIERFGRNFAQSSGQEAIGVSEKSFGKKEAVVEDHVAATPEESLHTEQNGVTPADTFAKREEFTQNRFLEHTKILSERKAMSPLLYAEIRAALAGSLSAIQPAISDSFPSAKTNLTLHSPSYRNEQALNSIISSLASDLDADLITLTAQDLAQIAGDYLGEGPEPTPHSIRSLGYETYRFGSEFVTEVEELTREDAAEEEQGEAPEGAPAPDFMRGSIPVLRIQSSSIIKGLKALKDYTQNLQNTPLASTGPADGVIATATVAPTRNQSHSESQLEDLKLATLLETLVDANDLKRDRAPALTAQREKTAEPFPPSPSPDSPSPPRFFDFSTSQEGATQDFTEMLPVKVRPGNTVTVDFHPSLRQFNAVSRPKIIHIKDIKELSATQNGSRIIQKLEDIIRKQRSSGQSVMLLGTTCSEEFIPEFSSSGVQSLQTEGDAGFFRTIVVPILDLQHENFWSHDSPFDATSAAKALVMEKGSSQAQKRKYQEINVAHVQDMLRCLDPEAAKSLSDPEQALRQARAFEQIYPSSSFWKILSYNEVHRVAITALGLHVLEPSNGQLSWAHVALSLGLLKASDEQKYAWMTLYSSYPSPSAREQFREQMDKIREADGHDPIRRVREKREQLQKNAESLKRQREISRIGATANKHEKKLMHGIVNPDQIKTTFDQVHVPRETVEAIRTLTSLSLLRPDAFNYGVLATEKISGALLYGPPGTGKTLLAKAVAKESGSTVLEVSGSQIMDKYVGEGEKNVAAVFSLARKLSPCIVFLDEADAIFGSRDSSRERTSHRDILNQFLKEWDGLNDLSVFVMVATNRPFDMDDAVIRRLPRRLLVDLPTQEDRKKIMEIHLRGEQLDGSVDLGELAKRTPLYSGSDLKNVAVFAALACVREENEQAAIAAAKAAAEIAQSLPEQSDSQPTVSAETSVQPTPVLVQGQNYSFPERRTLHLRHFDKALQEVSASISEDMSSLTAIKKFDEQYGDRKGQRKKKAYGFGVPMEKDDNAARILGCIGGVWVSLDQYKPKSDDDDDDDDDFLLQLCIALRSRHETTGPTRDGNARRYEPSPKRTNKHYRRVR
ncbi:AAA-domain-containing protein [Aaosphaeria arxii CBS 175.79]|uniref:AAA-domain-containing protein n=1 Tax=Aaosphaeria arxii CBS 175.79 TaxID=1450172 RepID=A0A6A5XXH1_9PLEO|nr:AAA-domain-containing protein [Aaosphaeria arxii CBS 175.79]KAF2017421.1 AAA-domain-containing protein [Aaosphaeria arxii CBS 175.79]